MFNPAHPGELIKETLDALREESGKSFTMGEVAAGLHTTRKTLSSIINGKQGISPEMAVKLAASFTNTTPVFWLTVQANYDLAKAKKKVKTNKIRVFWKPTAAL